MASWGCWLGLYKKFKKIIIILRLIMKVCDSWLGFRRDRKLTRNVQAQVMNEKTSEQNQKFIK